MFTMSEITEISIQEEFGIAKDAFSNIDSLQFAELSPGQGHTFHGRIRARYLVVVANSDSSHSANQVDVYHRQSGDRRARFNLRPLACNSINPEMTSNGIRVYNRSSLRSPGRPRVTVQLVPIQ